MMASGKLNSPQKFHHFFVFVSSSVLTFIMIASSIRCTQMGSYVSMEASGAACKRAIFDELNVKCFRVNNTQPGFLGRCFIEVYN